MIQIRQGLFETNSSSVHALVVMSSSQYSQWCHGKFIELSHGDNQVVESDELKLYTIEEIVKKEKGLNDLYGIKAEDLSQDDLKQLSNWGYFTYNTDADVEATAGDYKALLISYE